MNNLLENNILEESEINIETLEILKEVNGISMQFMVENALKGPNMATRKSVDFVDKEETKDNNRGDVEYE